MSQCTDSVLVSHSITKRSTRCQFGKPTRCSMIALKRVARFLMGARDFVNKHELDIEVEKHVVKLDGFSD